MKSFLAAFAAAAVLSLATTNLKADSIVATLDVGLGAQTLISTPILNGFQYTYLNTTSVVAIPGTAFTLPIDNTSLTTFLATYVKVGGVGVLNVTDLCAQITILGTPAPCKALAFSFTDLSLGNATLVSALLGTNINLNAGVANFALGGANVALSGGAVDFTPTPPTSPVPEPGTLGMMATGLLGAAGAVRRKFMA
jgi:hypothetical protein